MNLISQQLLTICFSLVIMITNSFSSGQQDPKHASGIKTESETSVHKLVKINNDYLMNELYLQSLSSGKRLTELEPGNANFNYRYGVALNQTSKYLEEPITYLKKAAEKTSSKADMFNPNEKSAPTDAIYLYALALHRFGEIDEAIDNYKKFIAVAGNKHPLYNQAALNLTQAENAKNTIDNKEIKELVPLNTSINTNTSEFAPIVSFDGTNLYFTSGRPWTKDNKENQIDPVTGTYYEDIYVSSLVDNEWTAPEMIGFCSPSENEASISVSVDERRVYIYNSETGNGDIYYSNFENGKFNQIKKLNNDNVNTEDWQTHYTVSPNGKMALFTSNNPKGFGGLDIYMITKNADNTWSAPVNLGPEINTKYDEDAPFISFDGKTLYYASNNERSIGGFDIFKAEWKDGKFINSENLGTPVNSTYDDLFFSITADGLTAYISSFRKGGHGELDIYQVIFNESNSTNSVLKGRIYLTDGYETIPENIAMQLKCIDCSDEEIITLLPRIRDGKFYSVLEKCKKYELKYINSVSGKEIAIQNFSTNCEETFESIEKELGIEVDENREISVSQLYTLRGSVFDKETNAKLEGAEIEVQDKNGKTLYSVYTRKDGTYVSNDFKGLKLNSNTTCKLIINKPGYISVSKDVAFVAGSDRYIDIEPIGIEKSKAGKDLGKVMVLNTIYYDLNSSYLRKDAKKELDKIVQAMNLNPNIVIELGSHTDCREDDEYNQWLSDRRAMRAAEYIKKRIKNGDARITGKGYGETQLLNNCGCEEADDSNCSEEQHQMNRRTEFIIVKE